MLSAGDYFGETALLSNAPRNATVRCLEDAEVLRLSREDFEAGFLHGAGGGGAGGGDGGQGAEGSNAGAGGAAEGQAAAMAARQTLGFIQMVSCMQRSTLSQGQPAFCEGDVGDRFYIIDSGEMVVEAKGKGELNRLGRGDCFGELALLSGAPRNATVRCDSATCQVLSMHRDDFRRLMDRSTAVQRDMQRLGEGRAR